MANYELMVIIDPRLSEEENTKCRDELHELFKTNTITVEKEDIWGDKKLAYKINGSERGFYMLFDLNMDGTLIKEISKTINLNRSIWRYMFVKKDS